MPNSIASSYLGLLCEPNQKTFNSLQSVSRTKAVHVSRRGRSRLTTLALQAAVALLTVIAASTASLATEVSPCAPASPNFTPDFTSNQNCITWPLTSDAMFVLSGTATDLQMTTSLGNQVASAWFVTPQLIVGGFTTTFQFQFSNPSVPPADGIAFVIQNTGTGAIGYTGGNGGALGYGDDDANTNPSQGEGIPDSLAIEFDSFQNAWDPQPVNGVDSHVAIQSCGTGPNTSHHGYLCGGSDSDTPNSTVGQPVSTDSSGINIADGNVHTVTIVYTPTCSTCSPATTANIQVSIDGVSFYPTGGVSVDLGNLLNLGTAGTAFVGFTGATGGDFETQNILDWTFTPTQGQPINPSNPSSLNQNFVISGTPGQYQAFNFNYAVSNNAGDLTIPAGSTPFINNTGITQSQWASIVGGTAMADASCLIAAGQNVCAVNALTCTTNANSTPSGANCPSSSARNVLFGQEYDLNPNQTGIVINGGVPYLTIPAGYAPGLAMAPDTIIPGGQCSYPSPGPLANQVCPQSILTQLEDNTPHGGGTASTPNSSYVFFCCEPEWQTTPTIPLWSNSTSVSASFTSTPPPTPSPNNNNFQAAQGASVIVGAEPFGTVLDTTYPLPGEQTLNNAIQCPALGSSPDFWSNQTPQTFSVKGVITTYDNNGSAVPLTEGAYSAHYFSVDCDAFEELVFPPSIDVQPGTPTTNVASFKTVPFNIDLTKPEVTSITLSPSAAYYPQNSSLSATVSCTDPTSSNVFSGIATCGTQGSPQTFGGQQNVTTTPITLNTSTVGTQTFTAVASDVAGNVSSPSSVTYQVVGSAGLAIAMVGDLLVPTNTNMTYYIAVANTGPSTADEVSLADTIPAGTTFVSSGYAPESCALILGIPICSITPPVNSCGSVPGVCNIGALSAWTSKSTTGVVVQITVSVNAKVNTTLTDTATVTEVNTNPNSKHDTVKWETLVVK
jgi:uncharacterized repeat protein (TIGR01451 family)